MTSLREIKLLREIHSPYVVDLLDVFPHKKKLTMVCRRGVGSRGDGVYIYTRGNAGSRDDG